MAGRLPGGSRNIRMKDWPKAGCLPDDKELIAVLKAADYGYDASDALLLERKDDMRKKGLARRR